MGVYRTEAHVQYIPKKGLANYMEKHAGSNGQTGTVPYMTINLDIFSVTALKVSQKQLQNLLSRAWEDDRNAPAIRWDFHTNIPGSAERESYTLQDTPVR